METYSDSFYKKADDHVVCQDYAISYPNGGQPFAILSDGCSSALNSEYGAFILSHSLSKCLINVDGDNIRKLYHFALNNAENVRASLEIPQESLYATLLMVRSNGAEFQSAIMGDGFIVSRERDSGIYHIVQREVKPQSAPYYPAYWLNNNKHNQYLAIFSDCRLYQHKYLLHPNGDFEKASSLSYSLDHIGVTEPDVESYSMEEYDLVTVFSDSLSSFYTCENDVKNFIPLDVLFRELLAFKGIQGSFVSRRMQSFFRKTIELGWRTADDFSCGGISRV